MYLMMVWVPGFFYSYFKSAGHRVTAIDYSEQMIEQAKRRFRQMKIDAKVMQMDAQNLKFADESFDVVVSRNVIWNLDDPSRAYNEMYQGTSARRKNYCQRWKHVSLPS